MPGAWGLWPGVWGLGPVAKGLGLGPGLGTWGFGARGRGGLVAGAWGLGPGGGSAEAMVQVPLSQLREGMQHIPFVGLKSSDLAIKGLNLNGNTELSDQAVKLITDFVVKT